MASVAERERQRHGTVPGPTCGTDAVAGAHEQEPPLGPYTALLGLYNLSFVLFLLAARASGRSLPKRVSAGDIVLMGLATYKLSRLATKDLVTRPLRVPFTEFEGLAGEGETYERPRGEGLQRAVGELLTCPFCVGTWIAALFAYGLVLSPPLTRFVASLLASHVVADFLHLGFGAAAVGARKPAAAE